MAAKPKGAEKTESQKARIRWLREIEASSSHEKDWRDRAKKVVERYRDERDAGEETTSKFNILYANTEILKGSTYAKPPIPIVRRRWDSSTPVGIYAAKILERAISYNNECVDIDDTLKKAVEDMYLPGRAVACVKYKPTLVEDTQRVEILEEDALDNSQKPPAIREGIEKDDKGYFKNEPYERVVYEKAPVEYVDWKWVRISKAPSWQKVRWVALGDLLTRDECIKQFGKDKGRKIKLTWKPDDDDEGEKDTVESRALVWKIWNKPDRKVYVLSEGFDDGLLDVQDDPLKLEDFFPIPEPLYDIRTNGSMIPIPNFCMYQDQADELDELTQRITMLVAALKRRGVYDSSMPELERLSKADDNEFIAVENMAALKEKGGLETAFMSEPIHAIAQVLLNLYQQREQCKGIIYEVTGISDIVRGESKASETLGAQQLKAQYASLRVKQRQTALQRFALHLMRLQGEIISEHFSQETLAAMTGVQLPTQAEKEQAQQAQQQAAVEAQMAQTQGQPAPPQQPPNPILALPSWEEVMQLIRDDHMRGFNLEIETDSTIAVNEADEQEAAAKMIAALSQVGSQLAPAVQQGMISAEASKAIVKFAMRKFRASREVEDALEAPVQPPEQQQDPMVAVEQQKAQAEQQLAQQKLQADQQMAAQKMQADQQKAQADNQLAMQRLQMEQEAQAAKLQMEQQAAQADFQIEQMKLQQERELALQKAQIEAQTKIHIAELQAEQQATQEIDRVQTMMTEASASQGSDKVMGALTKILERLTKDKEVTMPSGRTATIRTVQ